MTLTTHIWYVDSDVLAWAPPEQVPRDRVWPDLSEQLAVWRVAGEGTGFGTAGSRHRF